MKKILFIATAIATIAACQTPSGITPETPQEPNESKLKMNVGADIMTKVTDTYFENGDQIGVYVVSYTNGNPGTLAASGNLYDNVSHTYTSKWTASQEMYWPDKETSIATIHMAIQVALQHILSQLAQRRIRFQTIRPLILFGVRLQVCHRRRNLSISRQTM